MPVPGFDSVQQDAVKRMLAKLNAVALPCDVVSTSREDFVGAAFVVVRSLDDAPRMGIRKGEDLHLHYSRDWCRSEYGVDAMIEPLERGQRRWMVINKHLWRHGLLLAGPVQPAAK